jgi:ATP-dependent Lhr-like helicase
VSFDRLHPAVQHHIVNSLGWTSLRPLQEQSIGPVLDGEQVLLLGPTAGGKTEAAFFPLASRMLEENWSGLSVLYLCPLRALLNNLEPRLRGYAQLLGRRVGLWHGDVGPGDRKRLVRDPPDLLLTTPESLEVMLITRREHREALFAGVRAVVIDELHAFAGDDRGWHLLSLLERLEVLAGRPIQRLGLSATVGDPESLLRWLAGRREPRRVVSAGGIAGPVPDIEIDSVGSVENAAVVISRLHRGEKRLVFCDSRARVEDLGARLRESGTQTFVSHSSLSLDERREAERAFAEAQDCVILATSTLELGLDVGDLDRVIQIDAPSRVASFLQRLGRTGRRSGTQRNCLFLATDEDALLQATALTLLWGEGFVEPVRPPAEPLHLFAQQIMALALQEGGLPRGEWARWIGGMPGFAPMAGDLSERIVRHMLDHRILWDDQGVMGMGDEGEAKFGRRHFLELFSVFVSEPLFAVRHGQRELGFVHESSFALKGGGGDRAVISLAGRSYAVTYIDWHAKVAFVEATQVPGRSRWLGSGPALSRELTGAMRRVLLGADPQVRLSRRATTALKELRDQFSWLPTEGLALAREQGDRLRWWTFAGLLANTALAQVLSGPRSPRPDNLSLVLPPENLSRMDELRAAPAPIEPAVTDDALNGLRFADCLPRELASRTLAARARDDEAVLAALRSKLVQVTPSA